MENVVDSLKPVLRHHPVDGVPRIGRIISGLRRQWRPRRLAFPALAFPLLVLPAMGADISPLDCVLEPYEVVEVSSAVQGVINRIHVDRNDMVDKGQLLVELDSEVERTQVELARAKAKLQTDVELRETELAFHVRNEQRLETLYKTDTVSLHLKDEAETDTQKSRLLLRSAKDNKRLAELELAKAEAFLALRSMHSPISGVVVARNNVAGEFVEDQSILRLAQLDPLKVEVIVPVKLFGSITKGMQVEVWPQLAGKGPHYATVTMVDRMIDPASGTFDVRAELPNPNLTIPSGLHCTAQFLNQSQRSEAVAGSASEAGSGGDSGAPAQGAGAPAPAETTLAASQAPVPARADSGIPTRQVAAAFAGTASGDIAEPGSAGEAATDHDAPPPMAVAVAGDENPGATGEEPAFKASAPAPATFCATGNQAEITGYFVLADPDDNSSPTSELVDSLRDQGVRDLFVVAKGAKRGQVSLGFYSKLHNARKRQEAVAERGFVVSLAPRTPATNNPECETQAQLAQQ